MARNQNPIFVELVETDAQTLVNADGTTLKDLVTAGSLGARVFTANAATDEEASVVDVQLWLQRDGTGTNYLLATVEVGAYSGTDGPIPSVSLLDSSVLVGGLDSDGTMILGGADKLRVSAKAAVTSGKTVWITASRGDY